MNEKQLLKLLLEYEVSSSWLAPLVSWKWLQSLLGWYYGKKVSRKYKNLNLYKTKYLKFKSRL